MVSTSGGRAAASHRDHGVKVKLNENLPAALGALLRSANYDVCTVAEQRLSGAADTSILEAATTEERLVMTFDTDFADIRHYLVGSHAGVVVFRLDDQRWDVLKEPVQRLIASGVLEQLHGGLAIVDAGRVRLRSGKREKRS